VDTQAPLGFATLTTVLDNLGEPATVLNGGSTDDPRSLIVGLVVNLQAGDFVTLFEGDVRLGQAEVTGSTWVFTPTQDYALGLHSITARLEDAAGNAGALSNAYAFQVIAA
jgi:large repetitive protein